MEVFEETSLLLATECLSIWKRIGFMAYCCERMIPNYRLFNEETGFGSVDVLRQALDSVWTWMERAESPLDLGRLVSACDLQAPDTEDFSSIYTSAALDAASAVALTLESIETAEVNQLIEVATLARDTAFMFSDWQSGGEALGVSKLMHPVLELELRTQRESLMFLKRMGEDRRHGAAQLRALWSNLQQGSLPDITTG